MSNSSQSVGGYGTYLSQTQLAVPSTTSQGSMKLTTVKSLRRPFPQGKKKSSIAKSTNLIILQAAMHGAKPLTPLKRLQQNKLKLKRRDIDHTQVPKNLPSLVRARRKGFFGESDIT